MIPLRTVSVVIASRDGGRTFGRRSARARLQPFLQYLRDICYKIDAKLRKRVDVVLFQVS